MPSGKTQKKSEKIENLTKRTAELEVEVDALRKALEGKSGKADPKQYLQTINKLSAIDMFQRFKKSLRNDPKAPKGLIQTATVSASPPSVAAGDLEALKILNATCNPGQKIGHFRLDYPGTKKYYLPVCLGNYKNLSSQSLEIVAIIWPNAGHIDKINILRSLEFDKS